MTQVTTLPSGLTVITEERADVESVAFGVFINAGTRDEHPHEHGLAHFLEHMAFKGTATRSAYQIAAEIEALGGDINAETSPEMTSYTCRMLAEDWQAGLTVLFDILNRPTFAPDDIALERDVVLQEIAASMDMPDDRLVDGLGLAAFGEHPIGQPILGTPQAVGRFDEARLRAFCERTYTPDRMTVSLAGAVLHDDVVAWIAEQGASASQKRAQPRTMPVFQAGQFLEARPSHDTHLGLAWSAPAFGAPGSMTHAFLVQILGGGMTSRLFQAIREEEGLVYAIDAYQMTFADCGLGVIQTATSADQVPRLMERLGAELMRFADDVSEQELAIAKRQFRASLAMAGENLAGQAARYARQWASLGALRSRQSLEEEIESVTTNDIAALWQSILTNGAFAKAAVGESKALDLWADWTMVSPR